MYKAEKVYNTLMSLPLIQDKDCSEYAEDLVNTFGNTVTMRTVRLIDRQNHSSLPFIVAASIPGCKGPYFYHTIVTFTSMGITYVADRLHPDLVIPYSSYIAQLKAINRYTVACDFIGYKGDYDTFDIQVHTLEKLRRQKIKVTYL